MFRNRGQKRAEAMTDRMGALLLAFLALTVSVARSGSRWASRTYRRQMPVVRERAWDAAETVQERYPQTRRVLPHRTHTRRRLLIGFAAGVMTGITGALAWVGRKLLMQGDSAERQGAGQAGAHTGPSPFQRTETGANGGAASQADDERAAS